MTEKKKRTHKAKAAPVPAVKREQTDRERRTVEALRPRYEALPARARSKLTENPTGGVLVENDGDFDLYSLETFTALGSRSQSFVNQTLGHLHKILAPDRPITTDEYNSALAVLAAVEPDNELEAMLGAQMIMANVMSVRCMALANRSEMMNQTQAFGNLSVKYMRQFTLNLEALAKLRRKGEQVVRHVHVHEGGQAVVADTLNQQVNNLPPRLNQKGNGLPYGTEVLQGCATLPCPDETGHLLPVSRDAERAVPNPRRQKSGASEGK